MSIATCTNCQAKFTDPADVASINSGEPYHCLGCATFAAANPAQAAVEQSAQTEHETEEAEAEQTGEAESVAY